MHVRLVCLRIYTAATLMLLTLYTSSIMAPITVYTTDRMTVSQYGMRCSDFVEMQVSKKVSKVFLTKACRPHNTVYSPEPL